MNKVKELFDPFRLVVAVVGSVVAVTVVFLISLLFVQCATGSWFWACLAASLVVAFGIVVGGFLGWKDIKARLGGKTREQQGNEKSLD